jgi:hypothetical protein
MYVFRYEIQERVWQTGRLQRAIDVPRRGNAIIVATGILIIAQLDGEPSPILLRKISEARQTIGRGRGS